MDDDDVQEALFNQVADTLLQAAERGLEKLDLRDSIGVTVIVHSRQVAADNYALTIHSTLPRQEALTLLAAATEEAVQDELCTTRRRGSA